jgi:hypothetical protein
LDPRPFIERLLDDEGLTGGLADPEARVLLVGLVERLEKRLAAVADTDTVAAECCTHEVRQRGRKIARLVAALCYETDPVAARGLWSELDPAGMSEQMEAADPVTLVKRLLDIGE